MSNNSTLTYLHQDHLTGTALVTSDNGTLLGNTKYYPYGDSRNSQGNLATDKLFTGQRLDGTGLYYYGARYYDPTIGRFISADSIVSNPANPQTFNRYTYALNNPLKYNDPTGHQEEQGTVTISGETYTVYEEDGLYYVANDEGRSGSVSYAVLREMVAGEMDLRGDYRYGIDADSGLPVVKKDSGEDWGDVSDGGSEERKKSTTTSSQVEPMSSPTPSTNKKLRMAGEVAGNTLIGCALVIGGLWVGGEGLALGIGGTIASAGFGAVISLGSGALLVAYGYEFVAAGIGRISQGVIHLPSIPYLPDIPGGLSSLP